MAKNVALTRIVGLKATTVGMLQGTFFLLIGLITAISYSISAGVEFADSTENILRGLTFGLAHGLIAIVLVPIIYFVAGWILGTIYGFIVNIILESSGGIVVKTKDASKE